MTFTQLLKYTVCYIISVTALKWEINGLSSFQFTVQYFTPCSSSGSCFPLRREAHPPGIRLVLSDPTVLVSNKRFSLKLFHELIGSVSGEWNMVANIIEIKILKQIKYQFPTLWKGVAVDLSNKWWVGNNNYMKYVTGVITAKKQSSQIIKVSQS